MPAQADSGSISGTAGYMSPEQVRGEPVDHRSDIFALGAILHEMLSGNKIFGKESVFGTFEAIVKEDPPPLAKESRTPIRCCLRFSTACWKNLLNGAFNLRPTWGLR
jgi:serine/threonine protein kinase